MNNNFYSKDLYYISKDKNLKSEKYFIDINKLSLFLESHDTFDTEILENNQILYKEKQILKGIQDKHFKSLYVVDKNFFDSKKIDYDNHPNKKDFIYSMTMEKENRAREEYELSDILNQDRPLQIQTLIETSYSIKADIIYSYLKDKNIEIKKIEPFLFEKTDEKNRPPLTLDYIIEKNPFLIKNHLEIIDNIIEKNKLKDEDRLISQLKESMIKNELTYDKFYEIVGEEYFSKNYTKKQIGFNQFEENLKKNENLSKVWANVITDYIAETYNLKFEEIKKSLTDEKDIEFINHILDIKLEDMILHNDNIDEFHNLYTFSNNYVFDKQNIYTKFYTELYKTVTNEKENIQENENIKNNNSNNYLPLETQDDIYRLVKDIKGFKSCKNNISNFLNKIELYEKKIEKINKQYDFENLTEYEIEKINLYYRRPNDTYSKEDLEKFSKYEEYINLKNEKDKFIPDYIYDKIKEIKGDLENNLKTDFQKDAEAFIFAGNKEKNNFIIEVSNTTNNNLKRTIKDSEDFNLNIQSIKKFQDIDYEMPKKGNTTGLYILPIQQTTIKLPNKVFMNFEQPRDGQNKIVYVPIFSFKNAELIKNMETKEPFKDIINSEYGVKTVRGVNNGGNGEEKNYIQFYLKPTQENQIEAQKEADLGNYEIAEKLKKGKNIIIEETKMLEYYKEFCSEKEKNNEIKIPVRNEQKNSNNFKTDIINDIKSNIKIILEKVNEELLKYNLKGSYFNVDSDVSQGDILVDGELKAIPLNFNEKHNNSENYAKEIIETIDYSLKGFLKDKIDRIFEIDENNPQINYKILKYVLDKECFSDGKYDYPDISSKLDDYKYIDNLKKEFIEGYDKYSQSESENINQNTNQMEDDFDYGR